MSPSVQWIVYEDVPSFQFAPFVIASHSLLVPRKLIVISEEQFIKALSSILVTLFEIVMLLKAL